MTTTQNYRTRTLGGTLLVLKGLNDCLTIERGNDSKPKITNIEGDWTKQEIREASSLWYGSEAEQR